MADAVSYDDGTVYAKDRSASVLFVIKMVEIFIMDFVFFNQPIKLFGQFQNNVSGEAIANNDIGFIIKKVAAFNIADEADVASVF